MNNFYRAPKLDSTGRLSQDDALSLYKHYLSTDRPDHEGVMRKPTRTNIFKAMCALHAKHSGDAGGMIEKQLAAGRRVLFWSDLHFFHNNIIRYCDRPFNDVEDMNNTLIKNYHQIVRDDDLVIFGGDIAFGEVEKTRALVHNFKGTKILVIGNHDFATNQLQYRDYGIFDCLSMAFSFTYPIGKNICNVLVTHYPVDSNLLPDNTINVHGHIHNNISGNKQVNISVEHMNYQPQEIWNRITDEFLLKY